VWVDRLAAFALSDACGAGAGRSTLRSARRAWDADPCGGADVRAEPVRARIRARGAPGTPARRAGSRARLTARGGLALGHSCRDSQGPGVLDQFAHLVRVDRVKTNVDPVVPKVGLARQRELLGLRFDERVGAAPWGRDG